MRTMGIRIAAILFLGALVPVGALRGAEGGRITLSLDGPWQVEEGLDPAAPPESFTRKAPVPGLADLAEPAFADVGVESPRRGFFWYRTEVQLPQKKERVVLRVGKAQFGTAVWVNGKAAGEHFGCFTPGIFDITQLVRFEGPNTVLVRVGAHPGVLPKTVPAGTDQEKTKWIPGIYDSVQVFLCDGPMIRTVQTATLLKTREVLVETVLENKGPAREVDLVQALRTWKAGAAVGPPLSQKVALAAGETKAVAATLAVPQAHLWTPDDPFLYVLSTSTGGDGVETRFGMRQFRCDTATRRAYLNDEPCFLRGSNITLHRFFEDPLRERLPWDREWVRKLLVEIPRKMHWNSFRLCIGPVPGFWLDLADEAGLLIQNEFFIWGYRPEWSTDEVKTQFREWLEDSWNHPSVAIWDACNETRAAVLGGEIIPFARRLDLSNRPWENGYNAPQGPEDPVEDHPYLYVSGAFDLSRLEWMAGEKTTWNSYHPTDHAAIINEYDWLWLNRDGTPTRLTAKVFEGLVGKDATADVRRETAAYIAGGLTEFWRARRQMAGVLHFVYLGYSYPGGFTSDNFVDLKNLVLEPRFEDFMGNAFSPLGVYLDFWRPEAAPGTELSIPVVVVNDLREARSGRLTVAFTAADDLGKVLVQAECGFAVPAFGQATYRLALKVPDPSGKSLLVARLRPQGGEEVLSRRKVEIKTASK